MTLQEIKNAIDQGLKVHWSHDGYQVVKAGDRYLIKYLDNDSCISLTWSDNVTLNGNESQFFIAGSIPVLKSIFREDFDQGDKWGSAIIALFSVANEISWRGRDTPPSWQYQPSIAYDSREPDSPLYDVCKEAKLEDLIHFGNILHRYTRNLDRLGESY